MSYNIPDAVLSASRKVTVTIDLTKMGKRQVSALCKALRTHNGVRLCVVGMEIFNAATRGYPKITISRGYVDVSTCAAQPAVREACDAASLLYTLATPTASFSYAQDSIDLAASRFGRYESSALSYYAGKAVNNTVRALFRNIVIDGVPNSSIQLADDIASGKVTAVSYDITKA